MCWGDLLAQLERLALGGYGQQLGVEALVLGMAMRFISGKI